MGEIYLNIEKSLLFPVHIKRMIKLTALIFENYLRYQIPIMLP